MSLLGDFLKLLRFGREETRAERHDQREERADERADQQNLLELINQRIDNLERLAALGNKSNTWDVEAAIGRFRALKDVILERQIASHPVMLRDQLEGDLTQLTVFPELHSTELPSIRVSSVETRPNENATVTVTAFAPEAGIGAYEVDVWYDKGLMSAINCNSSSEGVCNPAFGHDIVRFVGASATGLFGSVAIGTITFHAGSRGGSAAVRANVHILIDPQFRDYSSELSAHSGNVLIR